MWKDLLKYDWAKTPTNQTSKISRLSQVQRKFNAWMTETGSIIASNPLMPTMLRDKIERGILMSRAMEQLGDNMMKDRLMTRLQKLKSLEAKGD